MKDSGNNWSSLEPKSAFAHNTNVNCIARKTPQKIVFSTKTQLSMSLKLGLYRNKHKLWSAEFGTSLPPHSHSDYNLKNHLLENFLQPQLSPSFLERQLDFNASNLPQSKDVESRPQDHKLTETDSYWDNTST